MSDGHQRQMQLFVQDPNRFMDEFSQEFEKGFMQLMSHSYRSTRVLANTVYCDFISNRHHTHMNSTIWVTLSNFVQYLGRTNQCKIDKTPKGWYLQYVDNSPEALLRAKQADEMEKAAVSDEQRHAQMLRQQIEDVKTAGGFVESEFTELQRQEGDAPISFAMGATSSADAARASEQSNVDEKLAIDKNVLAHAFEAHNSTSSGSAGPVRGSSSSRANGSRDSKERKISAMESVRLEHEAAKKRQRLIERPPSPPEDGPQPWLAAGLIVKVMHQDLAGGKFYRKKGRIEKVHDQYVADVRMLEGAALIRIEQEMLETVIPNMGKQVRIVKGTHKGCFAKMKAVDFEQFAVSIILDDGTEMEGVGYDEVCKVDIK